MILKNKSFLILNFVYMNGYFRQCGISYSFKFHYLCNPVKMTYINM